ncbi:hypothetical protein RB195_011239 [Necator americanus]|uniref:Reverse transcriptase domain-containing protein n=1 Tax=Necator americanus TaxID=51031 RepID=A0ABR1D2E0_NECAM
MLRYLPLSGTREMANVIRSIWIDGREPDSCPLHKKLSVMDPKNHPGISLSHVLCKLLERIILDDSLNIAKKQRASSKLAFVLADLRLTTCSSLGE